MAADMPELIQKHIFDTLPPTLPKVRVANNHTKSYDTRAPTLYDRHMSPAFQLKQLKFDPLMLKNFAPLMLQSILSRNALLDNLRDAPGTPYQITCASGFLAKLSSENEAVNEESIVGACGRVLDASLNCASVSFFDLEESDNMVYLRHMAAADAETKADAVVALIDENNENWDPKLKASLERYMPMGPFFGTELKNIIANDPRVYLGILLMIALFAKSSHLFPWPQNTCHGCRAFANTHKYDEETSTLHSKLPSDGNPLNDNPDLDTTALRAGIKVIKEYIPIWDQLVGHFRGHKTDRSAKLQESLSKDLTELEDDDETSLLKIQVAIAEVFKDHNIDETLGQSVRIWLTHAIWITIQGWSQMVRINSTVHLVSSYNISWFIERNRGQGSAAISQFFCPEDHNTLLFVTGAVIHAYNDAKARLELDGEPWLDPFRRNAPVQTDFEDDAGDDGAGPDDTSGPDDYLEPEDDVGGSRKRPRGKEDDGGVGKKKKVNHPAMDHMMNITMLHIAFRSRILFSAGFSCFYRTVDVGTQVPMSPAWPPASLASAMEEGSLSEMHQVTTPTYPSHFYPQSPTTTLSSTSSRNSSPKMPSAHNLDSPPTSMFSFPQVKYEKLALPPPTIPSRCTENALDRAGIFLDILLGDGAVGKVWGGWMIFEDTSLPRRRIAMKISTDIRGRDCLSREVKVYQYLGLAGPRCYGVFEDGKGATALLLDFLGTRVTGFEEGLCPREKVYAAACALHNAHVIHNDLEPRNVLIDKEGEVHLVDFHVSQIDHDCGGAGKCDELDDLAARLGLQSI